MAKVSDQLNKYTLHVVRDIKNPRAVRFSIVCDHGRSERDLSTRYWTHGRIQRLGEGYFKTGLAIRHQEKYKCGCVFAGEPKAVRELSLAH